MCNQQKPPNTTIKRNNETTQDDYRFLDYRLTQLENKLERGLEQIETEQRRYNLEVMQTLQQLQEGQNKTTETMAKVRQRLDDMDEKIKTIDTLKDKSSEHTQAVKAVNHRVDVVQKILFAVGGAAISAFFTALVSIILLIMQLHLLG